MRTEKTVSELRHSIRRIQENVALAKIWDYGVQNKFLAQVFSNIVDAAYDIGAEADVVERSNVARKAKSK